MSVTVELDLPESVAAEARARGLFEPKRMASLIVRELSSGQDRRSFFEMVREIRTQAGEPMTLQEIQAEVDAVRSKDARVKAVVDTNTLISGSLWQGGPPARFLEAVASGRVELVLSSEMLAEFAEVVARPKFVARVMAKGTTAEALARKLAEEITIVSPVALPLPEELRDPKDLHVLECAGHARERPSG